MNLLAHPFAEYGIHHLMPCDQPLAGEGTAHDARLEVVAVSAHLKLVAVEPGGDVAAQCVWRKHL